MTEGLRKYMEPDLVTLAEREQAMRDEIFKLDKSDVAPGRTLNLGRGNATTNIPPQTTLGEPDAGNRTGRGVIDPEKVEVLLINLINGKIVTTMSEFEMNEAERAQVAFVAVNSIGRNLQEIITSVGSKYGIPELQQAMQEQATKAATELNAERQRQFTEGVKTVKPTNSASGPTAALEGVEDDDFDEAEVLPQLPKRQRNAAKRN